MTSRRIRIVVIIGTLLAALGTTAWAADPGRTVTGRDAAPGTGSQPIELLEDSDGDGIDDADDNCPDDANADQADADGDGIGDVCDDGDSDGDGVADNADACPNDADDDADADGFCGDVDNCPDDANADQADTDGDTTGDVCDACPLDPLDDIDSDAVCGDVDNCPDAPNSEQTDTDGDTAGDACDVCPLDPLDDVDGDTVCGDVDNCPDEANTDQADSDGDTAGDVCDICPLDPLDDVDGDAVCGDVDNCPDEANTDQANADGDTFGDVCDICPFDPLNDIDGDGVCGDVDNCPDEANPGQENADEDQFGDVCDPCPYDPLNDIDGDEVCGDVDNCPFNANGGQHDRDGDGIGDVCDIEWFSTFVNQFKFGTGTVRHHNVYVVGPPTAIAVTEFLTTGLGLDALDTLANGDVLFSVAVNGGITHAGGFASLKDDRIYRLDVHTGDVSTWLDFDGVDGFDIGTLDALDVQEDGRVAFSVSVDRAVTHGGGFSMLRQRDAYLYDPNTKAVTPLLDGAAVGIIDLDGLHVFDDGRIAFSTETNIFVAGTVLRHENVYRIEDDGSLTITLDGTGQGIDTLDAATFPAAPMPQAALLPLFVPESYSKPEGLQPDRSR